MTIIPFAPLQLAIAAAAVIFAAFAIGFGLGCRRQRPRSWHRAEQLLELRHHAFISGKCPLCQAAERLGEREYP